VVLFAGARDISGNLAASIPPPLSDDHR